jgi:hypothetical protein
MTHQPSRSIHGSLSAFGQPLGNIARAPKDTASPVKTFKMGKWLPEEDALLAQAIQLYGERSWRNISNYMAQRSPIQCLHRWTKILKPGLVKGPWTPQEDEKL